MSTITILGATGKVGSKTVNNLLGKGHTLRLIARHGASKAQFVIFDGKSSKTIFVRTSNVKVQGQTSGEWIFLGKYKLVAGVKSSVTITNKNADGGVVADAILFKPGK